MFTFLFGTLVWKLVVSNGPPRAPGFGNDLVQLMLVSSQPVSTVSVVVYGLPLASKVKPVLLFWPLLSEKSGSAVPIQLAAKPKLSSPPTVVLRVMILDSGTLLMLMRNSVVPFGISTSKQRVLA